MDDKIKKEKARQKRGCTFFKIFIPCFVLPCLLFTMPIWFILLIVLAPLFGGAYVNHDVDIGEE